jgi:hypothetical protein
MGLRKLFSILTLNERGLSYAIDKKRKLMSKALSERAGHTIQYGPFKGMKFSGHDWWGGADRAAMLLGLYEKEVLQSLMQVPPERDVFIDLGAADGYYSIGALTSGRFQTSHAFEMSEKGRRVIAENARLNACADRVHVHGAAGADFYRALPEGALSRAVLLVDVEGAEFDILTSATLAQLKNTVVLIELHDWFFADGPAKLARLQQDAQAHFRLSTLTTGARDLSSFPELAHHDDSERWLMASEGRNRLMTWLRLDPLA